ncbi:hypothetical protein FNV43_RR04036 [Rhamnella rubrinervis]|uniref:Uncharacterized protein n=1 Tax=Rhamnella rubrinervis TaxID=2594499 RepID=A0A8K0HJH3_9ROSA|nr:hypothetical protein FNV43_RR04036 [Rhamnella rubrinervis]
MAFNNNDDHWAFLEDIEAPMWVDLNLEAKSYKQDMDDNWFYRSHQFHECTSVQLKSAFSHSREVSTALDSDLSRPSSPKLPTSVSESRGKDFMSKKWRTDNQDLSLDKLHPVKVLSRKSSSLKAGSCDQIKQFIHMKKTTSSKSNLVIDCRLNGNIMRNFSNPVSANEDPTSNLSSVANKAKDSNTSSTITSESGQRQQQKFFDISSQTFGHTGSFLSVVRKGFRKSGVKRQASRMVITDDTKQSSGNKSSSSKSSVASTSNPGHDVGSSKFTLVRPKERTPDSRNVGRMTQAAKSKIKCGNVVKSSTMKLGEATSNNRREGKPNIEKSTHLEAAKRKVQHQTLRKRALGSSKVNQNSTAAASKPKEKSEIVGFNKLEGNGKENETSQKCNSRGVVAGGMIGGQRGIQKTVPQRNDIEGRLKLQLLVNGAQTGSFCSSEGSLQQGGPYLPSALK